MLFRSLKEKEFKEIYNTGRKTTGKFFILYTADSQNFAYGISIGRRAGNAVVRNRIRRRIKEVLRSMSKKLSTGMKIVVIPKKGIREAKFLEYAMDINNILIRVGNVS